MFDFVGGAPFGGFLDQMPISEKETRHWTNDLRPFPPGHHGHFHPSPNLQSPGTSPNDWASQSSPGMVASFGGWQDLCQTPNHQSNQSQCRGRCPFHVLPFLFVFLQLVVIQKKPASSLLHYPSPRYRCQDRNLPTKGRRMCPARPSNCASSWKAWRRRSFSTQAVLLSLWTSLGTSGALAASCCFISHLLRSCDDLLPALGPVFFANDGVVWHLEKQQTFEVLLSHHWLAVLSRIPNGSHFSRQIFLGTLWDDQSHSQSWGQAMWLESQKMIFGKLLVVAVAGAAWGVFFVC